MSDTGTSPKICTECLWVNEPRAYECEFCGWEFGFETHSHENEIIHDNPTEEGTKDAPRPCDVSQNGAEQADRPGANQVGKVFYTQHVGDR